MIFFGRKPTLCLNFPGSWINQSSYYDNPAQTKLKIWWIHLLSRKFIEHLLQVKYDMKTRDTQTKIKNIDSGCVGKTRLSAWSRHKYPCSNTVTIGFYEPYRQWTTMRRGADPVKLAVVTFTTRHTKYQGTRTHHAAQLIVKESASY